MSSQDYTTTFSVSQSPKEVFDAINNPRGWWSEGIEGSTNKVGGVFNYHYEDVHRCRIKVTELISGKKVAWLVLDNYFNFTKDKSEWKGTRIVFDISKSGNKTKVRFTHVGLVPHYECYNVCTDAWGSYIRGSLRNLIVTGNGQPN
ncbi:MAG: SRPBCC domain-containing protein [Nitrososphaerota archaeon]|nr:SRPBCC domain-containing protein [Nitrososphaerota archaeon]